MSYKYDSNSIFAKLSAKYLSFVKIETFLTIFFYNFLFIVSPY